MDKSEKKILIIVAVVFLVLIAVAAVAVAIWRTSKGSSFEPPAFDTSAIVGTPQNIDEHSAYGELKLPISNGRCTVSMAALPTCTENQLNLLLASASDNSVYVRVIIYNADEVKLGSSGLLCPGEYVSSVALTDTVESGSTLRVKILTYEPDTYYSLGSTGATITVR